MLLIIHPQTRPVRGTWRCCRTSSWVASSLISRWYCPWRTEKRKRWDPRREKDWEKSEGLKKAWEGLSWRYFQPLLANCELLLPRPIAVLLVVSWVIQSTVGLEMNHNRFFFCLVLCDTTYGNMMMLANTKLRVRTSMFICSISLPWQTYLNLKNFE